MGRRENFDNILHHKQPEKLIIDFGGNPLSGMEGTSMFKLLEYLGYDLRDADVIAFEKTRKLDERILKHFDIDTRSIGTIFRPEISQYRYINEKEHISEWGLRYIFTGMYWDIVESPLRGAAVSDLEKFEWPDPESINIREIEACAKEAKRLYEETDYVICAEHPVFGVFELGCWMCGFDDFLMKMALDEEFVHRFFEIILAYQKKVIEIYYGAVGKYIHYTSSGDDFATQNAPFISPQMFRDLIKPYFKERIEYTKKFTDAAYLHHSCGAVFPLIDDLIDCGVDILNPIQPKAKDMQPQKLKEAYGDKIVFHGGIDTQDILPFGTIESIEASVRETIEIMNQNGGYILAAAHNIQEDVPPENLVHMLKMANKYGKGAGI